MDLDSIIQPHGTIGKAFGRKRAIPVLCVHGRSDNLETFSQIIPLLPHNQYYVCIDLPGHGKSNHADKGYILDLLWYSMCVKRVIDYFEWPKLYYIGHSLGGQIGFILAALYPEIFLKMVIIDTIMFLHVPPPSTAPTLREYVFDLTLKLEKRSHLEHAPTYSLDEFVQKMKDTRKTEVTNKQIKTMAERNLTKVGPEQYKYTNDQRTKLLGPIHFTFEQLNSIATEISCPTLVILGKNSKVTKPHISLNQSPLKNNRNATFHVIEGDHDVHIAHAQKVALLIKRFLVEEVTSKL